MNDDYHIKVLTGDEARKAVKDILSQGVEEKNSVYYPYLIGTTGYFEDKNAKGEKIFSAFDNTTGDCWCEDFMTEEGAKQYCTTQVSAEDIHKSEVIKQIEDILAPYMQSGDHDTFFRMTLDVGEPRLTLGLLMDNRGTRHHVMVYPKENITGNGMRFSTNLSKDLSALPLVRLKNYVNNLTDLKETNQLMPAVIREVIDDELSADEDVFMGVRFDKPYDEEQQAIGDRYGCETMDQQTNECVLPDFDTAINYAYDNTRVLLRRGNHYREVGVDGAITFHVTQESADKNLVDLARKHGGDADMSHIGNPLVMAYFGNLKDAKAYRDEAKSLLFSNKAQTQLSEHKVVNNVDTIVLSKDSFAALYDEYRTRHDFNRGYPPYVKFDENGQFELEMEFHDGYARDLNPHGLGMYDRVGLYYPTVKEVEDSTTMQGEIERLTNRKWSEGSDFEKIFDIALRYGEASRVRCPNARYVDAVDAIVQRTNSIAAKAFTPEQRERIQLAAACNGEDAYSGDFREVFYEHLLHAANEKMPGVNKHWLQDTSEELKDLAHDKAWEHAVGIRR